MDTNFVCFDEYMMDEHHALQARYHNGDCLHTNEDGGAIMAEVI